MAVFALLLKNISNYNFNITVYAINLGKYQIIATFKFNQ